MIFMQRRNIPPASRRSAETSPIHPPTLPKNASTAYGDIPSLSEREAAKSVTGSVRRSELLPAPPADIAVFIAESGVADVTASERNTRGVRNVDI